MLALDANDNDHDIEPVDANTVVEYSTMQRLKGSGGISTAPRTKPARALTLLLKEQRDEQTAMHLLTMVIRRHNVPAMIMIGGSEANAWAIHSDNEEHGTAITKY
jgi:hypothetical protein